MVPSPDRTCCTRAGWTLVLCCCAQLALAPSARADGPPRGFFGLTPVLTEEHVEVRAVTPGGPADEAGVRLGDVLLTLDGKPVPRGSQADVVRAFTAFGQGEVVEIILHTSGGVSSAPVEGVGMPGGVCSGSAIAGSYRMRREVDPGGHISANHALPSPRLSLEIIGHGPRRATPDA
jgi:hypothetical protein